MGSEQQRDRAIIAASLAYMERRFAEHIAEFHARNPERAAIFARLPHQYESVPTVILARIIEDCENQGIEWPEAAENYGIPYSLAQRALAQYQRDYDQYCLDLAFGRV